MTPERWQKLKGLFDQALQLGADQREKFLAEACAADESLRHELDLLLRAHVEAQSFIERPAAEKVVSQILQEKAQLSAGQRVGQYEIIGPLGAGGMGEVYLAQDSRLKRKVALKLLPAALTENKERLQRFEQEARAASALNHPNILTIHEINEHEGATIMATEFVDGVTWRQAMNAGPQSLLEVLEIAVQVASALSSAHEVGIVHRDIKPENVMIRRDGIVKVLDFGLAKTFKSLSGTDSSEVFTRLVETSPGVVMGTVKYMSPEQARAREVDARSDIWSLGAVLYEVIGGRLPFDGETGSDVIAAILTTTPPPLKQQAPQIPDELQRIVHKALARDGNERYQTARDLLIDLKNLQRELDLSTGSGRIIASNVDGAAPAGTGPTTSNTLPVSPPSGQSAIAAAKFRRSWPVITVAAVLLVGVATALVFGIRWWRSRESAAFQKTEITQLTTSRNLTQVAISSDGKYVAYAATDGENESLWLRQANTANDLQLVSPKPVTHEGITFTRDSLSLYYVTRDRSGASALYRIPVLGGMPQKLITGVDTPITFSPDGSRLAFARGKYPTVDESALLISNSDGSQERILATQRAPIFFYPISNWTGPSWSPDGELIACAVTDISSKRTGNVYTYAVTDGAAKKIMPEDFSEVGRVEWLPDMSGLVIVGTEKYIGQFPGQIFYVSYPGGTTRRITNDFGNYRALSITSDASKLVTISFNELYGIWVAPDGDASRARQVLPVNRRARVGWTPDGRIVYETRVSGHSDIWIMNADGSGRRQLTSNAEQNIDPAVSPDGRYVAFFSTRTGRGDVWRIDIDGNNPRELTKGLLTWQESWTPDSQWILFLTYPEWKLWKVPVEGGAVVPVTDRPSFRPTVSPDGKSLACFYSNSNAEVSTATVYDLAVLSLDGASAPKIYPFRGSRSDPSFALLQWSLDGRAILYNSNLNNVGNIWSQPIDGTQPKQLTDFKDSDISAFAWSRDGRWLACARGTIATDAVMISQVK